MKLSIIVYDLTAVYNEMQRLQAQNRFNLQPIICPKCQVQQPNYRFLILKQQSIMCYDCIHSFPQLILSIQAPLKEYYYDIIRKLPLPDYKIAKACLESLTKLRAKAQELMTQIKTKISSYQNQLQGFLKQTQVICRSYLQKVKQIEQSKMEDWHINPPKLIDQEKFIINIKQKHHIASLIAGSLKHLQIHIPSIDQIKKQATALRSLTISSKNSITASINARGTLFLGANDGKLFYQHQFTYKHIQAHDSLIRALQHDGQFKLFSGSDDYTIKMWDIHGEQPQVQRIFGNIEGIKSYHRQINLLDGGRYLASSRGQFDQYQIRIWDLSNYTNPRTLKGHDGYIRSMIIDGNNRIVSASQDRYLKVWDPISCELLKEYFHNGRILYLFSQSNNESYCIIDQKNRLLLLDQQSLLVFQALNIGKKIVSANAANFIYVHIDRYVMIYNWYLGLEERVDLGTCWTSTNLIEMGSILYITDAHGILHQVHPHCLAKN